MTADDLSELLTTIESGVINNNQGKDVLVDMFKTGKPAAQVINEKGFEQISDESALEKIVDDVVAANDAQVAAYRGGNEKLFGFFVGQVMKASQGKANPKVVNDLLKKKL
jgi:aspartyl-tRNA(Asn)/glutamyl-tRNA(Gln) amidotransferase subunit B